MATPFVSSIQTLNLSASSIQQMTGWPEMMTNDYLTIIRNFVRIAGEADQVFVRVGQNEDNIQTNADNIQTNADNVAVVVQDLADHEADNSAHGVSGNNVGTNDFASSTTGGVVLLASLVADLSEILTSDVGAAPSFYSQLYTQEVTDLTNENKAKINDIVLKVNEIIAGQISSKQMAST